MKLLIVSDYFFPHWTGIVKSICQLCRELSDEMDISVLTVRHSRDLKREEYMGKTRILRSKPFFMVSRAMYSFSLLFDCVREVRKADMLIINSPCTNILPVAVITKLFGKRLIVFHQGDLILNAGVTNRIIELIFRVHTYLAMLLTDSVSTYTDDYAENSFVLRPFLRKFSALKMPVVLSEPKMPACEAALELLALRAKSKIVIGFAGRFVREKGFDVLYHAIPEILKRMPNAHFVFAGATELFYEDTFEQLADQHESLEDKITLLGLLDDAGMAWFYSQLDLFVMPSRSDCFGLVQAEAALSAVPVIVSDIPGARDLVTKTGFGILFTSEDPADLAEKVVAAERQRKDFLSQQAKVYGYLDRTLIKEKILELLTISQAALTVREF